MTTPTELEAAVERVAEKLAEIVSDDEIAKVHGYANFGAMTPREVVNDGVRKTAVGYHCGHTQFTILREHGLITKPPAGSYDANLTKKGKAYARVLYHAVDLAALLSALAASEARRGELEGERDEARKISGIFADHWPYGVNHALDDTLRRALCAVPAPLNTQPEQS